MYVHNSNCMFHVNTYASVTKVSIIKEDLMMTGVNPRGVTTPRFWERGVVESKYYYIL